MPYLYNNSLVPYQLLTQVTNTDLPLDMVLGCLGYRVPEPWCQHMGMSKPTGDLYKPLPQFQDMLKVRI